MIYVTTSLIKSNNAHSIQIMSMCKSFNKESSNGLTLISPRTNYLVDEELFNWIAINTLFKKRTLRYLSFTFLLIVRYFKKLRNEKIFTRDIGVAYCLAILKIDVTYEIHNSMQSKMSNYIIRRLRNKIRFIAISDALKQYLITSYKINSGQILVAHDGVFIDKYDKFRNISKKKIRSKLNLPIERTIIMHTGSLYKGRGIELIGEILKARLDISFVSIGGRPEDVKYYERYFSKYENIKFIGHTDTTKLIQYQMSADIMFFPMTRQSRIWWCTSPLKLFEYMATGNIILGSNIGSSSEIIGDANALIFDYENPDTIIKKLDEYFKNPKEINNKRKLALSQIREKYTWDIRARNILIFIKKGDY